MERYELEMRWASILELTKQTLVEPIWDATIQSSLIPTDFDSNRNVLQLMVMLPYKKQLIEKNSVIYGSLLNAVRETFGNTTSIEIQVMSMPNVEDSKISATQNTTSTSTPTTNSSAEAINPTLSSDAPISSTMIDAMTNSPSELNYSQSNNTLTNQLTSNPQKDINNISAIQKYKTSMYDDPVYIDVSEPKIETPPIPDPVITPTLHTNETEEQVDLSQSHLNPSFTFDNFVLGNPNRIAYSAASSVAESPAESYNPLFIYGPSGLGKTHLMHAIGNRILQLHPNLKVMCITSEGMTNLYVKSVQLNNFEVFRQTFRNVDVLLVDDIQFIQNKNSTSEEFFHTFNILMDDKKQIVLTSDTLPKNMPQMHDRLRTRFEAGFIATIDAPDMEMRMGILHMLLKEQPVSKKVQVSDEVINFIAAQFNESIRPMQGAMKQLLEVANMDGINNVTDINYVRRAIANSLPDSNIVYLTIEGIQEFVAEYYHIKKSDLLSAKRNKQFAVPRQISMYLCREILNESFPQIGAAFGKDHSTIIHAHSKIYKQLEKDEALRHQVEDIKEKINNRG